MLMRWGQGPQATVSSVGEAEDLCPLTAVHLIFMTTEELVMAQRESKLSRHLMEAIRREGYFCFKVHGGPTMMAGLPDIVVCARGLFIGLETKHPETRNDVSAKQKLTHDQIRTQGDGYVAVVCSVGEALDAIKEAFAANDMVQEEYDAAPSVGWIAPSSLEL